MTLGTLVISIAITALLLTLVVGIISRRINNWLVSYFQNFCGALFIFSGWVKAIDPLGTAYKLEQYFAEFESTFNGTWFSFLSPLTSRPPSGRKKRSHPTASASRKHPGSPLRTSTS